MRITSLASGSSGNALVIHVGGKALLVDCGLPQRTIERHLRGAGLTPHDLAGVLLTHEHGDHAQSAGPLARRYGLPLLANGPTLAALEATLAGVDTVELPVGEQLTLGPYTVRSFPVPHDAAAPVGYTICGGGWCAGVAIDLGSWDARVVAGLMDADIVIIEANHDRERLRNAPYQWPVKQRIFSPYGHLDNIAAAELLAHLAVDGRTRTAWLAHLSEQANSPELAVRMVRGVLGLNNATSIASVHAMPRRSALTWESDHHLRQALLF